MRSNSSIIIISISLRLAAILILATLIGSPAFAQGGKGTITGRAADAEGAVLPAAKVQLEPGDVSVATDRSGEFSILNVAPGSYKITVSYIGFRSYTADVKVVAGQATRVDALLTVEAKGETVTVVADAQGVAEAINIQRTSDNILDVMSAGVIASLPNENIADVVGRLPGVSLERDEGEGKYVQIRGTEPRLNSTTVDGLTLPAPEDNVRQMKLDVIPAGIVDSVQVNKTLAANQDADAIGGSVNLITKKAGDAPTLSFEGIGGLTPIVNTRYVGLLQGTVGQRFGSSKRFGALLSASYDYNGRGIDDIEPQPDLGIPGLYDSMDIREYRYERSRYGFGGSLDYKLKDPASGLYAHYFGSDFKDYGNKWVYTLNNGAPPQFSTSSRVPDYGLESLAIGGKHVLSNSWISWELAVARARELGAAGNPGATFDPVPNPNPNAFVLANQTSCVSWPTQNFHLPQWQPTCTETQSYDPTQYYLSEYDGTSGTTSQVNLQGAFSMAKNYHLGSHSSTFEFGFKERNAHKGQNAYSPTYDQNFVASPCSAPGQPACALMSQFLSGFTNPHYYFNAYRLGPVTSYNKIAGDLNNLVSQGVLSLDQPSTVFGSDASNFDLTERVSAAYAMNTVEFGKFRLQTGLRIEATQLDILGFVVTNNATSTVATAAPQQANTWYWDPLPSVQLRYALTPDSDIRAVYARAISRPNPYDMVPYVTLDNSSNPLSVGIGNPDLKPEHANNYDILYEHYLKPYGLLQGGFFYKQLSQPIYYLADPHYEGAQYPQYQGDIFDYIVNGTNAKLYGIEAAYTQRFGFLPGAWSGFGLSANFSKTGSSAGVLPLRTDNPDLQRQTPTMFNLSPTYDMKRFSARLGATYNSKSIYQYQWEQCTTAQANSGGCEDPNNLGPQGPAGDNYLYAHLQVDAQASYRFTKSLTVLAQGLNLTDMVFGFYNGSPWYVTQREYYRPTYSLGLRWDPHREY